MAPIDDHPLRYELSNELQAKDYQGEVDSDQIEDKS